MFLTYTRNHWLIEKGLHWQLDVSFKEDRQRVRKVNRAENMAVMRKLGLHVLKRNKGKLALKIREKGWIVGQLLLKIAQDFFEIN